METNLTHKLEPQKYEKPRKKICLLASNKNIKIHNCSQIKHTSREIYQKNSTKINAIDDPQISQASYKLYH